jgi:serine/threonine protein kinase
VRSYLVKLELWVAMEYMDGGSLTEVIDHNLLTEAQMAAVTVQVCPRTLFPLPPPHAHTAREI